MSWVIRFISVTGRIIEGQSAAARAQLGGQYLASYDPEAHDGQGYFEPTPDISKAMRFESINAAWECWKQVPKARPRRADGEPNRPLTALSIMVEEVPSE